MILLEWKISFDASEKQWAYDPKSNKSSKRRLRSRLPEELQEVDPLERMKLPL
jgi:hypothetical protein